MAAARGRREAEVSRRTRSLGNGPVRTEIVSLKTPKTASGGSPGGLCNGSERWRRYEGPLGAALLLACARIEREREGEHAATGLLETRETAKDWGRASEERATSGKDRGDAIRRDAATCGRRIGEPSPGAMGQRAREHPFGRQEHVTDARERF